MRICCTADLHGHLPVIPDCDLLLLAGDLVPLRAHRPERGRRWLDASFRAWLEGLPAKTTVVGVAGNHDFVFQEGAATFDVPLRWTYLQDSGTTCGGLAIWGSPWQPTFFDWAFNLDEEDLAAKWDLIPGGTDVLLLHGPPFGHGDPTPRGPVGSPSLLRRIESVRPRLAVAGHIHSGYGVYRIGPTTFANASYLGEDYRPANRPIVLELTDEGLAVVDVGSL
ncbi:metallophosphoesterase family protein [Paludisphaera mucosa]|uniref:Metallophosphatase domain-containing protein n=1 Tax=Paludisphaera mucosa TaxID=3030827 RepID=A0ABT6FHI3_9BACT|nr:metallophosphatase domain-containing protein [Paludisphaera mucosa]MDG3007020.1 metallophosphatase domain-containing protein [Paludisphaera mucosa]